MSGTLTKMAFFVGVQTSSPVRIQLLSSRFRWDFVWEKDIHYGPILYGSIVFPLQLCGIQLSQNTPPILGFGPIFPSRSGCQFPEKSLKSPIFSSCFLLHVFPKIQPRCPRFLLISEVELPDIIPQLFLFGPEFS